MLSLKPKVLVLDEVTAGCDFAMKQQIWRCIRNIGETKILISHDMVEVKQQGDQIFVLKNGVGRMLDKTQSKWIIVIYNQVEPKVG